MNDNDKPIRVGLVRMDSHTMYGGVLMDDVDPIALRGPNPARDGSLKHGWQASGAYLYFYQTYREPLRQTVPKVEGFRVVKIWDEERELAEMGAKIFRSNPRVCATFDEVSDDVDLVFIGDCKTEGKDHLTLAEPGLRKGVATFIDKPLAFDLKAARQIVRIARENRAPILSLSILRETPGLTNFRNRLPEIAPLNAAVIFGCAGMRLDGLIHAISAAQHVFGAGVESVEALGADAAIIRLNYREDDDSNKPSGGVILTSQGVGGGDVSFGLSVTAVGRHGSIQSEPQNDYAHPWGMRRIVECIREMMRTGQSPVSTADMLENIAVADAVRESARTGRRVAVEKTAGE